MTAAEPDRAFDADAAWRVHPRVAVRPEPFGALLYHFDTRRLTFLKDPRLLGVVRSLGAAVDARGACAAAGVGPPEQPHYLAALARLAEGSMIVPDPGRTP
ncbi:MAG: mycofactocin biosynthesis chaperone MftB [Intrasporangium sp.]|uniref:mycofactocin biosynthesis chaperone MftB n=1 Tax=Intrasporangium sp. TaxID=1925024 RepID=UPI00264848FD|nr:mycofactocin biosynthesis chaperone MftB [Intrasporangium sp.]MDN5798300.1 mycofactocin biosynthesis chaperone MftB [Intrasporangium sp.]